MPVITPLTLQRFYSNSGKLLAAGKLYTYAAGTDLPKSAFKDSLGQVPHTNPIILNSRGEVEAAWDGLYKVILKDRYGATIFVADNIQGFPPSGGSTVTPPTNTAILSIDGGVLSLENGVMSLP